jgi:hypothetical protein
LVLTLFEKVGPVDRQHDDLTVTIADGRIELGVLSTGAVLIDMAPEAAWNLGNALRKQALNAGHRVMRGEG